MLPASYVHGAKVVHDGVEVVAVAGVHELQWSDTGVQLGHRGGGGAGGLGWIAWRQRIKK